MEVYLDNAASTRPTQSAADALMQCALNVYGNASSLHRKGLEAERVITDTRKKILTALHADEGEVYFASCGTECNNMAVLGYCARLRKKGTVIISALEHASVLEPAKRLETMGFNVVRIAPNKESIVNLDALRDAINDDTCFISIMHVNNETGAVAPLGDIRDIMSRKGCNAVLHVDAVQSFCKLHIPPRAADMLTLSAHKIHGVKGAGALYTVKRIKLEPVIYGGGQEGGIRSGTENVPAIAAFGAAVQELYKDIDKNYDYVKMLKTVFAGIISAMPSVKIMGPRNSSPYILHLSVEGIRAQTLLHKMEQRGVYIGTGAACSSNKPRRSHVLTALGFNTKDIDGSIRISFSPYLTTDQVMYAAECMRDLLD